MKSLQFKTVTLLGAAFACANIACGSSVAIGPVGTSFTATTPVTSVNQPSLVVAVDLSSMVGLVPSQPVRIGFTPTGPAVWSMGFGCSTGNLELRGRVVYEFAVGSQTFSFAEEWGLGPQYYVVETPPPSTAYTDPVGYIVGPAPTTRYFDVPWGSDLGVITFKLVDQSSIVAVDGRLNNSSIGIPSATFTAASVPEASSVMLAWFAVGLAGLRRRR